jgi:hypothetical protein
MTKGDLLVERGAAFLEDLSHKAASEGGFVAKLAEPLADDAAFLRKMKPTLVLARLRGEPPSQDGQVTVASQAAPPPPVPNPSPESKKKPKKNSGGGPNPLVIVAAAFVAGVVIAKFVDWRGHAHPRF